MQLNCIYKFVEKILISKIKHDLALNLDMIGFSASTICAIHCALMPFLLAILPLIGFGFITNPFFEFIFISISLVVGIFTFKHGYLNHHKKIYPFALFVTGLIIVLSGHFIFESHEHIPAKINFANLFSQNLIWISAPIGALLIGISHFINRKLSVDSRNRKCSCPDKTA